ncbi:cysteine-rich small domain-containing protein [Alkalibacter sp. M17DMB]|nr:cysteine-rich small domain-containing protein [Alkalibacter mobilis]
MSENFKFNQNMKCEYFPCHKINDPEEFNCLFCYCPLYALGDKCGGNFIYTEKGIKNCSYCSIPHIKENYDYIIEKLREVVKMTQK